MSDRARELLERLVRGAARPEIQKLDGMLAGNTSSHCRVCHGVLDASFNMPRDQMGHARDCSLEAARAYLHETPPEPPQGAREAAARCYRADEEAAGLDAEDFIEVAAPIIDAYANALAAERVREALEEAALSNPDSVPCRICMKPAWLCCGNPEESRPPCRDRWRDLLRFLAMRYGQ